MNRRTRFVAPEPRRYTESQRTLPPTWRQEQTLRRMGLWRDIDPPQTMAEASTMISDAMEGAWEL